jgi:hypothetical protein
MAKYQLNLETLPTWLLIFVYIIFFIFLGVFIVFGILGPQPIQYDQKTDAIPNLTKEEFHNFMVT